MNWPKRDTDLQYSTFKKKYVVRIGVVNWAAGPMPNTSIIGILEKWAAFCKMIQL